MSVVPITRDSGRALALANQNALVIASDLILIETRTGEIALYAVQDGEMSALGTFDNVADAWGAVDQLDAPGRVPLAA